MGLTKEDYTLIANLIKPTQIFSDGNVDNKYAVQELAKQIRKSKIKELYISALYKTRDQYLARSDYFRAACTVQLIAAWNIEFPGYLSIGIGQLDVLIRKYFR